MRIQVALATVLALSVLGAGCATKKYVTDEVTGAEARAGDRIGGVESQVESAQARLREHDTKLADHEQKIGTTSKTAQEALERAIAAGKLAEGKLLFETVLTDDQVRFGFDQVVLSEEARAALDAFAEQLKSQNQQVYIEVQGHTDAVGSEDYNLTVGERRAEAARRYLNQSGIPLHRMSVISYGESSPIADNKNREGRAQNRRVALVVLR
jgi:outer membrane protein OmpA-like peptidoglycan-associated protein